MKIYYAHPMSLYGTPQEQRDLELLSTLGTPINPSDTVHAQRVWELVHNERMDYFLKLVDQCDMVAFRAFPDGSIPSGVAAEITQARMWGKPVIELPCGMERRTLTLSQTLEHLHQIGQR